MKKIMVLEYLKIKAFRRLEKFKSSALHYFSTLYHFNIAILPLNKIKLNEVIIKTRNSIIILNCKKMRLILIFILKIQAEKLEFHCLEGDLDGNCEVRKILDA